MIDKNGKEMVTGDIVIISGSYFKTENGRWIITHTPGDKNWCGSDYGLMKFTKAGKLSTGKYRHGFWPIMITVSDRFKRAAAKQHNAEHAEIEVIGHTEVPADAYY